MDADPKTILDSLKSYQKQIHDMDQQITRYLSNRKEYPRPRHTALIGNIRQFENKIHNLNFGFLNTEIKLRLDNLMHSLLVHERCWQRLFERDAETS